MSKAVSLGIPGVASGSGSVADRVSSARRLAEVGYLWIRNGIGPREYDYLGLFRSSIPWAEKKNFASASWYLDRIERINPAELRIVAWNKIVTHGMLQTFGIPTPELYGFISPYNGQTVDGRPLKTAGDLAALLERRPIEHACFKLVGGWSGRGFVKASFQHDADGWHATVFPDGPRTALGEFWSEWLDISDEAARVTRPLSYGYLCQADVTQHPVLDAIHGESINTCRIWMVQTPPGEWNMFCAVLRMGTGTVSVDNGMPGGIGSVIDRRSGHLSAAVRRGRAGRSFEVFTRHPTSGHALEGMTVPLWDGIEPFCRRVCSVFPFFRLLALDLVIQNDGYCILEVEADPHSTHQAHIGRGIRSLIESLVHDSATTPRR